MRSPIEPADRAAIDPGRRGVDLCCCNGAGMRFLVRSRDVASMIAGYRRLLEKNGCTVAAAQDTGRFAGCFELYRAMLEQQLTCGALRSVGFRQGVLDAVGRQLTFLLGLAPEGKVIRGRFVARRL
jgi:hypothetical protein